MPEPQHRVLDHDGHVRLYYACEVCVLGDGLGTLQLVEALVKRAPGRDCDSLRAHRFAVGVVNRYLDVGLLVGSV